MYEKDYILRLIKKFSDALNLIINGIEKDNIEDAKIQINDLYRLLGNKEEYFLSTAFEELISFFKSKDGDYLKRVLLLAELFYIDSTIEKKDDIKKSKILKSQSFFNHYMKFSKEYSFEVKNKLILIKKEIDHF